MAKAIIFFYVLITGCQQLEKAADSEIQANFKKPPASSRPLTWWHWIHGHVTKDGITKDLETMKNVGIQGAIMFNVAFYDEGPVHFYSEEWWDHVAHAVRESDRLGLKFGTFNCEGWSMSGGPWIEPEESMKQLVWRDTMVTGGENLKLKLPQPEIHHFYKEVAVMAFPAIPYDQPIAIKKLLNEENAKDIHYLTDNDLSTQSDLSRSAGQLNTGFG